MTVRSPFGEVPVILCERVVNMPTPAKGSWPGRCVRCGEWIWLAPSARKLVTQGAEAICLTCLPPDARRLGARYMWGPGQKEELRAEGISEEFIRALDEYFEGEL